MASYLYILWDSWPISTSFHQLSAHLEMLVRSRKHTHPPTHIPWDSSNQLFKPWALARALPPTSQSWFRTGLDSGGHGPNWFTGLPLSIVKRYMLNNSGTVVARSFFFFFSFFMPTSSQAPSSTFPVVWRAMRREVRLDSRHPRPSRALSHVGWWRMMVAQLPISKAM